MVQIFSQVQNQVSFTPVHKSVHKAFVMHIAISFQNVVSSHEGNIPLLTSNRFFTHSKDTL